ncbi:achacin-like isoform X3 [Oculina patagonica]
MGKAYLCFILGFVGIAFSQGCTDLNGATFCQHYKQYCTSMENIKRACKKTCGLCKCDGGGGGGVTPMDCDVGIVGGGISGLYMAESLLRHKKETKVCVFERDTRLGGRIYDHVFPQVPDESVGLGAWRVDMVHHNMRNLISRLNIPHKEWNFYSNPRTETRGGFSRDQHEIKRKHFPALTLGKFKDMTCSQMLDFLLRKEHVDQIHNYATFETFQHHFLTPEGSRFYFDVFGYDGDLMGSPEGVVEYYEQLAKLSGKEIRPLKGMSAFVEAIAKSAKSLGAKIYAGADYKILSIDQQTNLFVLKTPKHEVKVGKLVIASPPGSFGNVSGSVAERIQREHAFQSILPRPAFKAAAVYPRAWWEDIVDPKDKLYPMERFLSNSDCLGWTVPHGGRGINGEAVLHVSYKDGLCGEKWGEILKLPKSVMDQEIHRALEYKFNRNIPQPLSTVYQYWNEGAWYLQKPGSRVSMKQVTDWAKRPFLGEQIYVVGSAYHPYRGYAEGAIMSANNALNDGWQIPIPSPPAWQRILIPKSFAEVDWRNIR